MQLFISIIIGFFIGSLPTAYLLMKRLKGIDITSNGSSNVGAMNTLIVSKSKLLAIAVLIIDLLKGFLSVYITKEFVSDEFIFPASSLLFAVAAHCYSPWIKFKGGRGLATAAGGILLSSIPVFIIWVVIWTAAYIFRRNIHFGNVAATILTGFIALTSSDILNKYSNIQSDSSMLFGLIYSLIMLVIFSRHIEPMKKYLQNLREKIKEDMP